ncbi:hydroxylamine oxidase [Candidatus Poribacteria bacterium]|nr:hydroxylamine oxidase [Candidatus Poribacteria bacterium]
MEISMNKWLITFWRCGLAFVLLLTIVETGFNEEAQKPPLSEETEQCFECHSVYTPGVVEDWLTSRHAMITPETALKNSALERRISSETVEANLRNVVVGCYECHALNAEQHKDNFEHLGFQINTIVSPNDCKVCHPVEAREYSESKKAYALSNLRENPVYSALVETIISLKKAEAGKVIPLQASDATKHETCYACHGTEVMVTGTTEIATDLGDISVPTLTNWPNQGVGRINPDGSRGACTACHPRHSFSIEIARKPYTCSQCHLQPDVPAWDVYKESKHGNIFFSKAYDWNWSNVPWKIGKDFKAPTCASCHNSLVTTPEDEVILPRTHDFNARLWVRLFGLIYSHPQPKRGDTYNIKNADGLPLPTTFTGNSAAEYLINAEEQAKRESQVKKLCKACHSTTWVNRHFEKIDNTIDETDGMTLAATNLLSEAWKQGYADNSNPFDELIEQEWIKQWLFYANSIRYASAMTGAPDYATFKLGWWELTHNLQKMQHLMLNKDSGKLKREQK